ncbi:MAG: HU family DNA-binding protein [Hallerella porci]|uniref:DNA-binding protein HU-beta/integration host factor subunit beta n=1 Tax=Hallerella porci TaxID=1945871 RepID=A0ABX5LI31_9BACT|nr:MULTISPECIES: HU family DNA-binding protein [Hallerella]MCI5601408.1 integration host factor subunit beta [Hallerella sp.]MDY3921737.1 HU family DNA-binding protein [Hallerella porci]PWK93113.1 DNA-binding protein HU-beta/integration host factor subunit beta [Hallerella porci]
MANVTKQDLIHRVTSSTGFVKSKVRVVVEQLLDLVGESLSEGNSIEIRGFGTFVNKERKSRPARNPKTGETVLLQSRLMPTFKFSAELKSAIAASEAIQQANENRSATQKIEAL